MLARAAGLILAAALSGSAQAAVGAAGAAVPVHDLGHPCLDLRYPALAGAWVVACGPDGRVDRALSLQTGTEHRLPVAMTSPGLGDGVLLAVGPEAALVRLQEQGAELVDLPRVRSAATAPPAVQGEWAAMVLEESVTAWPLEQASRRLKEAKPAGWYPPALAEGVVAWVADGGEDGEDVWALALTERRADPTLLSGGPGHQRHVVGSGPWLAWVEPDAIVLLHTVDGQRRRIPAETGFSAPPSLWQDVVCWETRQEGSVAGQGVKGQGVDIRCSDGLDAAGPGHQRWPSRHGPWLLYRQGSQLWLRTAAADRPAEAEETGEGG